MLSLCSGDSQHLDMAGGQEVVFTYMYCEYWGQGVCGERDEPRWQYVVQ